MADSAADLFDAVAEAYAEHRPTYPSEWFERLAERCSNHQTVWDCGCGNGQASVALAEVFERVMATDASPKQIQQALTHPRIAYSCASATASGLAEASVDAVLVAQAVHWFAGEAFNAEVRRVARPGAVLAWIGYTAPRLPNATLQELFDRFYATTLKPWWAPERAWVDRHYQGLPFPAEEWPFPTDLSIQRQWDMNDFLRYVGTWSAVETAHRNGADLLTPLQQGLLEAWPEQGQQPLTVHWPLMGRWGSMPAAS